MYAFRRADPADSSYHGTLVLQGSGVTNTFVNEVLPRIDEAGLNMNIFYVASAELFDLLPSDRREEIFRAWKADIAEIARQAVRDIGYTRASRLVEALEHEGLDAGVEPRRNVSLLERVEQASHEGVARAELRVSTPALAFEVAQAVEEHLPRHEQHRREADADRGLRFLRRNAKLSENLRLRVRPP